MYGIRIVWLISVNVLLKEAFPSSDRLRHGREKLNEGAVVPTPTEQSVFEALGLPYREPHERNH